VFAVLRTRRYSAGMAWYIPLLICGARIFDVSIGTVRMILIIAGYRWTAAGLGFIEVIVWVLAVGGVVKYLSNPWAIIAYGGGFALGTLLGMSIEDRMAIGYRTIRVINSERELDLSTALRSNGMRATRVEGSGRDGPVEIAFITVRRRHLRESLRRIQEVAPHAFFTVERADRAEGPEFHTVEAHWSQRLWMRFAMLRK